MEQYIKKSALVAEIEKKEKYAQTLGDNAINSSMQQFYDGMKQGCVDILSSIDTLEVKEMTSIELLKVKGFLVTDKDDYTAIYSTKPNRGRTEWVDGNHPRNANESSCLMTLNNARLIPDIKFNDKPIEVEVVIKAQKGGEV